MENRINLDFFILNKEGIILKPANEKIASYALNYLFAASFHSQTTTNSRKVSTHLTKTKPTPTRMITKMILKIIPAVAPEDNPSSC